jgi:putative FmdB family regulatory protein
MPLYDYKCEDCGMTAEAIHKITKRPRIKCTCGKTMKKQMSTFHFNFNCSMPTASGGKGR